jgi:hypothetical protein
MHADAKALGAIQKAVAVRNGGGDGPAAGGQAGVGALE